MQEQGKPPSKPTQNRSTQSAYLKTTTRILKRFTQSTGVDPITQNEALIEWIEGYANQVSASTWRLYRASLVYGLGVAYGLHSLSSRLLAIRQSEDRASLALRTSSFKAKRINPESLAKLTSYTKSRDNPLDLDILTCIQAGVLCGLRPIEWGCSSVLHQEVATQGVAMTLLVCNAKNTNGRSFADARTIHLERLTEIESVIIHRMLTLARNEGEHYGVYVKKMSVRLSLLNTRLFGVPKKKNGVREHGVGLSLYSGRHQFAANAKSAGVSPEGVAALMGHGSIKTAFQFYGKRRFGRGDFHATPDMEDLVKVSAMNIDTHLNTWAFQNAQDNQGEVNK